MAGFLLAPIVAFYHVSANVTAFYRVCLPFLARLGHSFFGPEIESLPANVAFAEKESEAIENKGGWPWTCNSLVQSGHAPDFIDPR
jgi:hypothetical protein